MHLNRTLRGVGIVALVVLWGCGAREIPKSCPTPFNLARQTRPTSPPKAPSDRFFTIQYIGPWSRHFVVFFGPYARSCLADVTPDHKVFLSHCIDGALPDGTEPEVPREAAGALAEAMREIRACEPRATMTAALYDGEYRAVDVAEWKREEKGVAFVSRARLRANEKVDGAIAAGLLSPFLPELRSYGWPAFTYDAAPTPDAYGDSAFLDTALLAARRPDLFTMRLTLHERTFLVSVGPVEHGPSGDYRDVVVEEAIATAMAPPPEDGPAAHMRFSAYVGHFVARTFRTDPAITMLGDKVKPGWRSGRPLADELGTWREILILADERVDVTPPPLDERSFFLDALLGEDVDEVRRAFAPRLRRALLEKARNLAAAE